MPCPQCQAFTGPNDQFCAQCGTQVMVGPQQVSEIIEDTPDSDIAGQCEKCGAAVSHGQLFCTSCGKPLIGDGGDE